MGRNTKLTTTEPAATPVASGQPSRTQGAVQQRAAPAQSQTPLPPELRNVAKFLGNSKLSGVKQKQGILAGKRASYFKGSKAISSLLSSNYVAKAKGPKITSVDEARTVLQQLIGHQTILRVKKPENATSSKTLVIHQQQIIDPDSIYVNLYEGSMLPTILGGGLLLAGVLAFVMFPLMPSFMHAGMRYVSYSGLGFLGFLFVLGIIRLMIFLITLFVAKPGIWLFPNLFADVGFFESFVPLWSWHLSESEAKKVKREERRVRKERKLKKREQKAAKRLAAASSDSASAQSLLKARPGGGPAGSSEDSLEDAGKRSSGDGDGARGSSD